jgi:hypothetical protein
MILNKEPSFMQKMLLHMYGIYQKGLLIPKLGNN